MGVVEAIAAECAALVSEAVALLEAIRAGMSRMPGPEEQLHGRREG